MMDLDKNRLLEYAYDLRSDLKHAFEQDEGQTPNHKDVQVMDWLIEQALKVRGLEDSMIIYKKESDEFENSTHIDNFMYEFTVNENGEIPCLITVHGIEHTIGITEKDARGFVKLFQMHNMK